MGALAQVLRGLPRFDDPYLLVGADHFDDAGVYRLSDTLAIVTTVDFFPPLVDDPYVFGQIAAANSLSDVYAMGGRAVTVLNIVGFPDNKLPVEILGDILRGGAERVLAAGAVVAGGHSVRDKEIKFGLSVTGVVDPARMFTNGGAKPGDVLVLSKPIGSGVLTSAAKARKIDEAGLAETISVMIDLNAAASEAAIEADVRAVTDITGFGLIGHAFELADASGVSIELEASKVPLLDQTLALARRKILTRAYKTNLSHLGNRFAASGVEDTLLSVLADAQTSGGLLMAVGEDHVDELVTGLKQRGTKSAAIVGRAVPKGDHALTVS